METDAETQSKSLSEAVESCRRWERRIKAAREVKNNRRKPTESINLGLLGLKETELSTLEEVWDRPRPFHICNRCASGSSCVTSEEGAGPVCLRVLCLPLDSFSLNGLPCVASIEKMYLNLLRLDMPRLVDIRWRLPLFWEERKEWYWVGVRERDWGKKERK